MSNYIVVFNDWATTAQIEEQIEMINNTGGKIIVRYTTIMKGFTATLTPESLSSLQSLVGEGIIEYIEPDSIVSIQWPVLPLFQTGCIDKTAEIHEGILMYYLDQNYVKGETGMQKCESQWLVSVSMGNECE